ncbi:glucose-6-phosphate isomerase [uncultured Adlercreutzia sp.]|uniref:glucose-6-phosphate isomerase n=1 Tax=uncultured Adlercreutzia sp. TaxID=875803 RepID=UPI0025DCC0E7|nr:glucose-6-phosphate isomerase [uncultured Adlercreutzia sp.]MCI9261489.1 glucose-6-phosphate isomerase [Eggerthellaceae bacterium]
MLSADIEKMYPAAKTLVKAHAASRIHQKDATLYDFSPEAEACAAEFLGWADLATNPPCDLARIQAFADEAVEAGLDTILLIGQGGSTQAPMTITKYNKHDSARVKFRTLDSDSPVRVREMLTICDPRRTLVIISSKSGGTIEPRMLLEAVRASFEKELGAHAVKHLVAITDPGSDLEKMAREEGWRAVFSGEPTVGGRFSALSVFGLVPAALAGIDMEEFLEHARQAEEICSEDAIDNPAINLAAFLYDNYLKGRNKFSFLTPKRGRVLGLWIEQLVAESLGKEGQGILPNIEIDSLLLTEDPGDRTIVMYQTQTDLWDERRNFEMSLAYIDPAIPRMNYRIDTVAELAEHFVMWEYAIAMCGYLMQVSPFDQPDVASAKAEVLDILENGQPEPNFTEAFTDEVDMGTVEVTYAPMFEGCEDLHETLYALLSSIQPGDFFALNAFLPFTGEGRREAIEQMRHGVAESFGVVSCLEVGPRYLHSTGQLQKGGPNMGVFLILSADELKDIPLPEGATAPSLGALAKAQAAGDLVTLAKRGRRAVHLHLPDNSGVTLRLLAQVVDDVIADILTDRALAEAASLAEDEAELDAPEATAVVESVEASETQDVGSAEPMGETEANTQDSLEGAQL